MASEPICRLTPGEFYDLIRGPNLIIYLTRQCHGSRMVKGLVKFAAQKPCPDFQRRVRDTGRGRTLLLRSWQGGP